MSKNGKHKTIAGIADLTPDPANANRGTKRGLGLLDNSLRQYGAGRSILADKHGVVIAGNKTLERAADIGLPVRVVETDGTELVVVQRTDLDIDSKQGRELAYADNRVGQVDLDWNPDQLLADVNAGIDLANLFGADDLDAILRDAAGYNTPADDPGADDSRAAELQAKWKTELGQLWAIGRHRLLCGDCTVRENVERVMGGEKAGAVVTDPPYGINREGIENDDPEGLRALFDGCMAVLPVTDAVVIAFQSPRLFPVWLDAIRSAGQSFERALWMHKANDSTTFPWRGWLMVGEIIVVSSIGKGAWKLPAEYKHDCYVVELGKQKELDGLHTTPKPPEVVTNLIDNTVGIVYEPFCGSGTTIVACERLGRQCRAIEISAAYVGVTLERLSLMGLVPELIG